MNFETAKDRFFGRMLRTLTLLLVMVSADTVWAEAGHPLTIAEVSKEEALRLGARMYREGILPSGEPLEAIYRGDIPVTGKAFTCISCHLRSGLGSIEGRVFTPPTNGDILFRPQKSLYKGVEIASMPPRRAAYTDDSLADAIRGGLDPSGRTLNEVMPRYMFTDEDMKFLVLYLKSLSTGFSPGFSDGTLRLATIVSEDVRPEERDAMLVPLQSFVALKNRQAKVYESQPRKARMALPSMESTYLKLTLSLWELKGRPETWRAQLEEYYRREPVFAIAGGITASHWQPIHQFSEDNQVPCVFPVTDLPVVSESDWYTLYLSKGYYQEGEGAARYLNNEEALLNGRAVVQIVRASGKGSALASGFEQSWRDLGRKAPVTLLLEEEKQLTKELLEQVMDRENPAALVLWDDSRALPALDALTAGKNRPAMVIISSGYLGEDLWRINEEVREFTYITYPFRLPQEEAPYLPYVDPSMRNMKLKDDELKIVRKTYSIIQVLSRALTDMRGNYYRDNFLDVIGMMPDLPVPLYERLSFGPGQRYASKGCYIVQLSKGPRPELIKKSGWIVY
ncbi:MAG: amino acid ABC transporter substrate-binding protein [Nitrospirae bacterium]|nr:amino acid ABC transporter substrate-binding protein [Nitrospirota bacterium]